MKRARWLVVGTVLVLVCCAIASLGVAQVGGMAPNPPTPVYEAVVAGPQTILRVPGAAEQKILKALDEPVDFEFDNTPLNDMMFYIMDKHKLQFFLDRKSLEEAAFDTKTLPITARLQGIKLRSALNLILADQGLAWLISDEVMVITTKEKADSTFETRLYDVHDLITNDGDPMAAPDFDSLIRTIVATVKGNWQESGGGATIRQFSNNGIRAISVAQTYDGHEQIESLLAELRKLKPQQ